MPLSRVVGSPFPRRPYDSRNHHFRRDGALRARRGCDKLGSLPSKARDAKANGGTQFMNTLIPAIVLILSVTASAQPVTRLTKPISLSWILPVAEVEPLFATAW